MKNNNRKEKIFYFGYGAMASPKLMETLLGRKVRGRKARLYNYGIFVNRWEEIPIQARKVLRQNWNRKFSHYSIKMRRGDVVEGKLYKIIVAERERVSKFNLVEEGMFTPIKVVVKKEDKSEIVAETDAFFTSNSEMRYGDGFSYPYFLNHREKVFNIAQIIQH